MNFFERIIKLLSQAKRGELVHSEQPTEAENNIIICFTHSSHAPDEIWDEEQYSIAVREALIAEFHVEVEEVDIHPGASLSAYATFISENIVPLLPWLIAAFFSAKPIRDNLSVWLDVARRIRQFMSQPIELSRNGAAVLAVEAVFEDLGGIPRSVQLLKHSVKFRGDSEDDEAHDDAHSLEVAQRTEYISTTAHRFEVLADGVTFFVDIEGTKVELRRAG